jgi:hypothetical protein
MREDTEHSLIRLQNVVVARSSTGGLGFQMTERQFKRKFEMEIEVPNEIKFIKITLF